MSDDGRTDSGDPEDSFAAMLAEEMPDLGATWFKWYEREQDGYDDAGGFIVRFTIEGKSGLERDEEKKLRGLVRDAYGYDGCGHSYDCCGCVLLSMLSVTERDNDVYVEVNFGRNY